MRKKELKILIIKMIIILVSYGFGVLLSNIVINKWDYNIFTKSPTSTFTKGKQSLSS